MLSQEFYRSSYRNMVNTVEARDPGTQYKTRLLNAEGHPVSKYSVNREEAPYTGGGKTTQFKKVKATRSYLRCEILLQPTLTSYSFAVLQNVAANNGPGNPGINPTEQRLKLQDVFFCNRLGYYLYMAVSNSGVVAYRYILFTSPNSLFLSTGVDPIQMYAIWTTGQLQVTVNNDVLTPAWDMLQHLYIPMVQGDPTGAPAIANVSNYLNPFVGDRDGLIVVEPNWVLNGGNDNEYVITFPQSLNTMGINSTTARFYLVLKMEGFLVQNVSAIMDNK